MAYVLLTGTDTGHVPLSLALLEVAVMGAIGGVVVAAFALGFAKLAELVAGR
jgi:hypothetical protein